MYSYLSSATYILHACPRDELEYCHDLCRMIRIIADGRTDHDRRLRRDEDDRFNGSKIFLGRYNVITRVISVHRAEWRRRNYTWRGERQLILTFLSENQSVVIPEAACVISSLSRSAPAPAEFRSSRVSPMALEQPPFRPYPSRRFPFPTSAFPIRLILPPSSSLHHARAANLLLIATTKHPACDRVGTFELQRSYFVSIHGSSNYVLLFITRDYGII